MLPLKSFNRISVALFSSYDVVDCKEYCLNFCKVRLGTKSHLCTSRFFINNQVQLMIMLDNKGSLYLMDAVMAIFLLLTVFLIVNTAITMPTSDYSYENKDIKTAQDIMELLSGKIDFNDGTFISEISTILEYGKNSKESQRQVSEISKDKLNSYNLKNYCFKENNILKGQVLASNGDLNKASDVDVATRTYGGYSYTLYVW